MTDTNNTQEAGQEVPAPVQPAPVAAQPAQLPTEVLTLIETRLMNEKKSTLVAYLLLFFLGGLGIHLFYLGKPIQGVGYILCLLLGCATVAFGIGYLFFVLLLIGIIIDLFRTPGLIKANTDKKRGELILKYRATGSI